jgi:putative transposase
MILTYKIKHNRDFKEEIKKAKDIAIFAINNRNKLSTKYVKYIGLKSIISNQILRKYGRNKKTKSIKSIKLTIPNQGIKVNKKEKSIHIPCLKLKNIRYYFPNNFKKINQIEVDNKYLYVSVEYQEPKIIQTDDTLGVDLNTTGHCAVVSIPKTGKVYKFGKKALYIHNKYKEIRRKLQKKKKYKLLTKIKNRESNIIKDLNHKISKKIIDIAVKNKCHVNLEDLKGIRKARSNRSFRYSLNSWSFYQILKMIDYKAKKKGILVTLIDPRHTSQRCSRCGSLGERNDKSFKCPTCGHVDHADVNAAFNIALASCGISIGQLTADRDAVEGNTDIPKEATL